MEVDIVKVYMYYIVKSSIVDNLYKHGFLELINPRYQTPKTPLLYAHTTDKKIAKLFKKTRNMENIKEVIRSVDKSEYEAFPSDNYRNLRESSICMSSDKNIVLPLTGAERWNIENGTEVLTDLFRKAKLPPITIFEDDIGAFLDVLDYGFNSASRYEGEYDYDSAENMAITRGSWANEFGMLIVFYSELFNIEGCIEGGIGYEERGNAISDLCRWR